MTRLELVNAIRDPIKDKPMSPLNKSYKEKCLKYLADKYNMEPELLDLRFKGHKSASKFVSSVIQKYRQSQTKFERMTTKFRCGLSLQHNIFKLHNISSVFTKISSNRNRKTQIKYSNQIRFDFFF